jgi:oligopeptide/dipeptide ABC transporter ATP-binding protein
MSDVVLAVEDLNVWFRQRGPGEIHAVQGVTFTLSAGERLGLVGESGCGKTTTAMALMGLLPPNAAVSGRVIVNGVNVLEKGEKTARPHRWVELAMIFQSSMSSFNPVRTIGRQIQDTIALHHATNGDSDSTVATLLARVGLRSDIAKRYPHELSGGMRQRAMIATALSCRPKVIIADEPTTALDVVVQAQILDLLERLSVEDGLSIILITHDLPLVTQSCTRAAVMYAGRIVEAGSLTSLHSDPRHPYTAALFAATPSLRRRQPGEALPGAPPRLDLPIVGCSFAPRCPKVMPVCRSQTPALAPVGADRLAACFLNSLEVEPRDAFSLS